MQKRAAVRRNPHKRERSGGQEQVCDLAANGCGDGFFHIDNLLYTGLSKLRDETTHLRPTIRDFHQAYRGVVTRMVDVVVGCSDGNAERGRNEWVKHTC